ncbi:uncharacterized protein LOC125757824 [Rhipicephalus sanguineus]|uniref:Uncharacterized protein n=1 Tax=Rhipicephalus sanguineus TaxID=34632 RepID=A0A9D4PYL1_RHISA|nr:uncharacterized protein LOC125757824 [Rhipicephalus sanguineus]KAH7961313.1 hypothetical protein HPB52_007669 [Rhipicephalus sanguineus]
MGPHSSGGFRWLTLLALVVVTLPAEVLPASRKKSSSSKKTTYYYYQPAEYRGHWYHQWPDTLTRRSFGSWEDTYDEWLPWKGVNVKTLLAHKHHHLHHGHGHARSGCGLEAVLVGILLIVPLMVLIGLMLPIVLIIISVMVGAPLLVPAVPPALLPPLTTEASQGRRRRQVFGEPLEDVLVTTLEKLLVAVAKYGDL